MLTSRLPGSSSSSFKQDSEEEETDIDASLSLHAGLHDHGGFRPYVPEDFANFEIYNAALESHEGLPFSRSDSKRGRCGSREREREVPRSPTVSSCTSGYFSHSASNATLSDVPFSASESSDHLSCASREPGDPLGCAQTKNTCVGGDSRQPAPSACGVQTQPTSSPIGVPNCTEKQQTLALSGSQEFTDFKGADDSELVPFTEGWKQGGAEVSMKPQKNAEHLETGDNQHLDLPGNGISVQSAASKYPNNADCAGVADVPTATRVSDKAPSPSSTAAPLPAARSSASTPRAGGEPPIQEPAQGDLPHGSPCPSPNPSSAEPSGDSSGDESTPVAQLPDWMAPGEQVWVGKRRGTVYYVGGVEFAKGIWIGVKLDLAVGESLKKPKISSSSVQHICKNPVFSFVFFK